MRLAVKRHARPGCDVLRRFLRQGDSIVEFQRIGLRPVGGGAEALPSELALPRKQLGEDGFRGEYYGCARVEDWHQSRA